MESSELARVIADFLAPFLPALIAGQKESKKTGAKVVGGQHHQDSQNLATVLWRKLRSKNTVASRDMLNAAKTVIEKPRSKRVLSEFSRCIERLLEQDAALAGDMAARLGGSQQAKSLTAGNRSVVIGGDVSNSTILNGMNSITYSITQSLSEIEVAEQAEALEEKRLAEAISQYVERLKEQVRSSQERGYKSPYKPLLAYDIPDSSLFFGRNEYIAQLLDCIKRGALTVLTARSGSGKSSLLRAGIGPHLLSQSHLPVYVRPGDAPSIDVIIKRTLLRHLEQSPGLANASLHDFLSSAGALLNGKWLVVIVDQFEEIFTLQSQQARDAFIRELAGCLNDEALPVRWILSLRSEKFTDLSDFNSLIQPFDNYIVMKGFNTDDARLVITEPARSQGVSYQQGLVDEILKDLAPKDSEEQISPPQLQIICSRLYEIRGNETEITSRMYHESLGGANGILKDYLSGVLNREIPKGRLVLAQRVLIALITSEKNRVLRSRKQIESELVSQGTDTTQLDNVLRQLIESHLVHAEEKQDETNSFVVYELTHDYLANDIELDLELRQRKYARELLAYKVKYYQQGNIKLSAEELKLVTPHLDNFDLTQGERTLIQESRRETSRNKLIAQLSTIIIFGMGISVFLFSIINLIGGIAAVASLGYVSMLLGSVGLLGIVGANRGWAKELLVSFGAIVGIAINQLLSHLPAIGNLAENSEALFWVRTLVVTGLVYFGYQAVVSIPQLYSRATRERFQDSLLGAAVGAVNGYLIAGTIWAYLHASGYSVGGFVPVTPGTLLGDTALKILPYLPPYLLTEPYIYFAVVLAFVFVIIIYI